MSSTYIPRAGSTDAGGRAPMTITLGSVVGIQVRVHISVLVIFALIVSSLGGGLFPQWHPEWSVWICWVSALAAGVLFFVSLLIHELSHSVMAKRRGIEISGITLFLFGGMAEIKGEPRTPKDEFVIAAAGPLASLILAVLFSGLASMLMLDQSGAIEQGGDIDFSKVGAIATICLWLGAVNMMLALFNLLPGFPMDGGRLFRAALWWRNKDYAKATRTAAQMGGGLGWVFIFLGLAQVLSGQALNGFWLMLIGWFIRRLAQTSLASVLLEQALDGTLVDAIMRTRFERIPAYLSLADFRDDYVLRSSQLVWPVTDNGLDIGFVDVDALALGDDNPQLDSDVVARHLIPLAAGNVLSPDHAALDAMKFLAESPRPVPVVQDGKVVGIIHHMDILRWFAVHFPGGSQ